MKDIQPKFEEIQTLSLSENWKDKFEAIEQLRILNKFHFDQFCSKLPEATPFIEESIDNLRSNISKNSLLLVSEIFAVPRIYDLGLLLEHVLRPTLLKTTFEKQFIAKEAAQAMKHITQTHVYK
jgi:hypothetical protein